MTLLRRIWREDEGVLSFEWILLVTLFTLGIVGGIAAARDAVIDELGDVAEAMLNLDQSYQINDPLTIFLHDPEPSQSGNAASSEFADEFFYFDCVRAFPQPTP
jgi:Flp pilus assembly pilin Flp